MPTVPVRQSVPTVGTEPLPNVRLNPNVPREAFGGVQPPDVSPIQGIIGQMYEREKAKANQIAVNDADNQATTLRDTVLYGTQDNPGILMKRGKDAFGALDGAMNQWKQGVSDITNSLTNDQQKLAFYNRIDGYDHNLHEQVQAHVAAEHRRYDTETTDAYVANRVNDASRSFANPETVERNIALANAILADHAKGNGLPPEWLTQQQQKTTSAVRLSVVQQMLVANEAQGGGDLRASAYLAQHRSEFTARDLAEADRLTEAGSVEGESQRVVDGILKTATSLSDAQQKIGKQVTDPKVRIASERRARQYYSDQAASDRDARNGAFVRSSQAIQQGASVDQLPLGDRVLLSPDEYLQLDHVAERIRHPVVDTPPSYFTHWMNLAGISGASQEEFLNHDFGKDRASGKLSESDFHHFTSLQLALRTHEIRADESAANRADLASAASSTRLYRLQETATIKALDAYQKASTARATMDTSLTKFLPALRSPSIPKAMADSAANDPEYMDYLKFHGYNPESAAQPEVAPPQPRKSPGGAIIKLTPQ